MFKQLKLKFAEKLLYKESHGHARKVHFYNFNTAKLVGILYQHTDNMGTGINELLSFFNAHHIKTSVMSYIAAPSIPPNFIITLNKFLFCKGDLNWRYKPVPKEVQQFIDTPFDLLIDFTNHKEFPIHYIASLSQASMKVGRNSYANNPYDFIVSIPEQESDAFYIEQLKHYLEQIVIKS